MKFERQFNPLLITVETPEESNDLLWAVQFCKNTDRYKSNKEFQQLMQDMERKLAE